MAYLTNDHTGAQTAQVTRLLRDEATDNTLLLLELIDGGGCNRRIIGYLFAILAFHPVKEAATKALVLLRRHAQPDTVLRAEKLREGVAYHYIESDYLSKLSNAEFDIFDFLLASRMITWHRNQSRSGAHTAYFEAAHQTLNLSYYTENVLSEALATLDFVKYITLPAHKNFDLDASLPVLKQLPVESLYLENMRMESFPTALFQLPKLRALHIKKGTYRPRHPVAVPELEAPHGCATLEKLFIDGYPITDEQFLGPFPALTEANLTRCGLVRIDFLAQSTQLRELVVRHNNLTELPAFIANLTELRTADFTHNHFERINIDLTKLVHLIDFDLKITRLASN
jgi:hypothetical protein